MQLNFYSTWFTYIYSDLMLKTETVTISKVEYEHLKEVEEIDFELLTKIVTGLEDVKAGRVREWK